MYRVLYRHLLSRLDAEFAHDVALGGLRLTSALSPTRALLRALFAPPGGLLAGTTVRALGLEFAHPIGLAGGFDKEGTCLGGMGALGFSHVEVGTVTPRPQPGNPRRRLFRLPEDEALINRMGFPSSGAYAVARNLGRLRGNAPRIALSLGKNKDTPLIEAGRDYAAVLRQLYPHADCFVVNVSSPNTPELRRLQTREYLDDLLALLRETLAGLAPDPKPLLVKVAPDLTWAEIDTLVELALRHRLGGVVATNTTLSREGLRSPKRQEEGGLSGRPLRERSTEIVRHIYRQSGGSLCIIGVGGVFTGDDAWEKLEAGASLVQAYTGFVYEGPAFVRKCMARLQRRMREAGIDSLAEIIGASA